MSQEFEERPETRRVRRPWYAPWITPTLADSNILDIRKGSSLVASATRLISEKIKPASHRKAEAWMGEAWTMFDLVGELHFLSTTLARRAARARFYVGKINGADVIELTAPGTAAEEKTAPANAAAEKKVRAIFGSLGDGFIGIQEIVERAFLNQFVVGVCYLVGAPKETWDGAAARTVSQVPVSELVWKTLSVTEFSKTKDGYELRQTGMASTSDKVTLKLGGQYVYVVQLWSPHPADSSVPDSPVRAALPILREIVGLTQHISAQVDSRLAGAGILWLRSSISRALKLSQGIPEDDPRDIFTERLVESMITPISDRDSASAVVPFVVTIPDETKTPEYTTFTSSLDQFAVTLREEAIRRSSLALDAPPELLMGQTDANHWSAWLTAAEVVDSHISPTLALIARGLTTEFLRPILRANGVPTALAEQYAIWFDTSDLTVKANQSADAQALFNLGILSEETTRRAAGFDESDAPKRTDVKEQAIDMVKAMVEANPGLMNRPGLDVLVSQIEALLNGNPQSGLAASAAAKESSGSSAIPNEGVTPPAPGGGGGVTNVNVNGGTPGTSAPAAARSEAFGSWDK